MNHSQLIQRAESFIQWLDRHIDGVEVGADRRSRLAVGCQEMALEHQKAIVLLVAKNIHGSAFALIRLIFESYVRGLWLHKCATDLELDKFSKGREIGRFAELCAAVEKIDAFNVGVLSSVQARSWKAMNGFTHSGMEQISRRHTAQTIEPNYDEAEIVEAVNFACGIGWLAAIAICDVAGNVDLANSILQKVKELFPPEDKVDRVSQRPLGR